VSISSQGKYVPSEHTKVYIEFVFIWVRRFQEEHDRILERRVDPDSDITWDEYKSMKFTSHVCTDIIFKKKINLKNTHIHGRVQMAVLD
jgi:hypothetical protein